MSDVLPASAPQSTAPQLTLWQRWRQRGVSFLAVSILVHILFGVGAIFLIVQTIQAKRKQNFAAQPSSAAPTRAIEHKVQMQKKQRTMSAPAPMKRITTAATDTRVALPCIPAMPTLGSNLSPVTMAGIGGSGLGTSFGNSGSGSSGSGRPASLFGFAGNGNGLEGTFYDYKMDQTYAPIKGVDTPMFQRIVRNVLPVDGSWHPDSPYRHFTSPAKLHGRYFIFPAIQDNEAGASFQSPRSGPGSWLAVYRGGFSSSDSGSFRFVGFGDNVMIVKVGNHIVLDASDHGLTGAPREAVGNIAFPGRCSPGNGSIWRRANPRTSKLPSATRVASFAPGCSSNQREVLTCRATVACPGYRFLPWAACQMQTANYSANTCRRNAYRVRSSRAWPPV